MFSDFSISFLFDSVSFRLEYFIFSPCCRFPAPPRFSADVQLVTCWSRSYDVCSTPETKTYSTFPVVQDRFILSSLLSSPSLWHMIRRANWTFIMQIRARPRSSSARIPGKKPVKTCRGTSSSVRGSNWIESLVARSFDRVWELLGKFITRRTRVDWCIGFVMCFYFIYRLFVRVKKK